MNCSKLSAVSWILQMLWYSHSSLNRGIVSFAKTGLEFGCPPSVLGHPDVRDPVGAVRSVGDSWQMLLFKSGFKAMVTWLILGQVSPTDVFSLLFC